MAKPIGMIDFKANRVPEFRRKLPFVNKARSLAREKRFYVDLGNLEIVVLDASIIPFPT